MPTTIPVASLLSGHLLHAALLSQLAYDHADDVDDTALRAELLKLGCELVLRIREPSTDTHCFVCRDRTPGYERLRVVFRGTASFRNARTDLDAVKEDWPWMPLTGSPGYLLHTVGWRIPRCHKGMTDGYRSVRDRVIGALMPFCEDLPIETNGHSLGADEAEACALDVALVRAGNGCEDRGVTSVTFGAARYGDEAFAELYARYVGPTTRVVHDMDIVPTVPINLDRKNPDWVHVGQELRILDNGRSAWPIGSWWRHLWADLTGRAEGDHPIARYIAAIQRMP